MDIELATGVIEFGKGDVRKVAYPKSNRAEVKKILQGQTYPRLLLPGKTQVIVDVGANVGISAIFFAMTYPEATVFAFEPHKQTFDLAQSNTASINQVRVFNFGLDDQDRTADLYVGGYTPSTNSLFAGALWNSNETVSVDLRNAQEALRDLGIEEIDILKIDTEGCEVPILRSVLKAYLPKIVHFEYHSESGRRLLDQLLEPDYFAILGSVRRLHLGNLSYARRDIAPLLAEGKFEPIGPS